MTVVQVVVSFALCCTARRTTAKSVEINNPKLILLIDVLAYPVRKYLKQ